MGKMNKAQKSKRNFRNSKAWKEFRHRMNVLQNGKDPLILDRIEEELKRWY